MEHPEAVTGETTEDAKKTDESQKTVLPWYKEMAYSFKQADQSDEVKSRETSESTSTGESDTNGTSQESGGQQQTSQDNNKQQSGDQQE